MVGRDPEKAEAVLVGQLQNALHEQIRKFIRKNNGGPCSTATLQTDVRMDITRTRSLRALVYPVETVIERTARVAIEN
ncbi:MAG: hypothetical protein KZQ66_04905 [Candidatus Thiodiazotropha sp. (ex Lucinoma aequizonata)]|nr:hypothetical protein [Candidatus Thiodiazotropha sp. (ex Lucinoma aequizonata)]MCU7887465.1 hypothetical protein [Candidatus Thiodiazotropha sp. (ex Lucinoma aequizonata)]MCU7898441.1 hypothetical protein [Candidatus Thiodiazotropha sp. (ex Lucinoma aequizonata)]MCU7901413.1 hypothetical protein [Candidatus Thiodiazotropha sp. (ex Lucinoma aequizonata)]MCU7909276.1 hypothetical protein [Candidatus Thiodiazotropha sp. (ex Lucinoma aequizonata)]